MISRIIKDKTGSIILSIMLGLGLAAMLKRTCRGNGCIVVQAPNEQEINDNVYSVNDNCYKYTPEHVPCDNGDTKNT